MSALKEIGKGLMLCKDDVDKFLKACPAEFALWSPKLDGVRCVAWVGSAGVTYISRNGKTFENFYVFNNEVERLAKEIGTDRIDGEAVADAGGSDDFSKVMTQVHRIKDVDDSFLRFKVFDYIPKGGNEAQLVRYAKLVKAFSKLNAEKPFEVLSILPHMPLPQDKSIDTLMTEVCAAGYEGLVIKDARAGYRGSRALAWCKVKPFFTEDVEVIDMFEGTGKYKGMLGGVYVDYKGKKVKVGSGFTDSERDDVMFDATGNGNFIVNGDIQIGTLIEVKYQEVTKAGSLRFPTFVRIRGDK